jgi:hypothetical protein
VAPSTGAADGGLSHGGAWLIGEAGDQHHFNVVVVDVVVIVVVCCCCVLLKD